jgi:hypothetical protein
MNDFSIWWKNMCVGSFFLFLMFLAGGVINRPAYYGDVIRQIIEAADINKIEQ